MSLRYVLIRDDATVADIDEALDALRRKRALTRLDIIRAWITADIDELLERRSLAALEAMA